MMDLLRSTWKRMLLRGVHHTDRQSRFDLLYRMENPWHMEGAGETYRFQQTNQLIASHFGRVGSILEVGCGEGHQSQELLRICDTLQGIDVSGRAVERARHRCPQARFEVGDVFKCKLLEEGRRYDLVVACEVMCYMSDVSAAVNRLSQLGRACFVTYYEPHAAGLECHFDNVPSPERSAFSHEGKTWRAIWWGSCR